MTLPWFSAILAGIGILSIAGAVSLFQEGTPFPGVTALLPTLGAAAIILGGALAPQSTASKLLSSRPFVAIGLLSYSWYLWHWPLLAIVRAYELGAKDLWRDGAIAFIALGLAWLTYSFVEHPIRSRKVWSGWTNIRVLGAAAAAAVALIAAAEGVQIYANRLSTDSRYERFVVPPRMPLGVRHTVILRTADVRKQLRLRIVGS